MAREVTFIQATHNIHQAALDRGMDVSPEDVAFILSVFLETCVVPTMPNPESAAIFQQAADEIATIKDEG